MKRKSQFAILIMLVCCVLTIACKKNLQQPDVLKDIVLPANASGVVLHNTDFAFDILHATLQNDTVSTNKMISPLSIYLALSMLYNGADHATRDSIQYALRLNGTSIEDLNTTCKALMQQMPLADNQVNLSIANSIWYHQDLQPLQRFLNVNDSFYNAQVQALNFNDPTSVNTINNWVVKQTNGKITKIIDALEGEMLLINAVYFKGSWKFAFDKSETANATFTTGNGNITSTPFMSLHDSLHYWGNDSLQIVQLPYGGGNFNMYVMLPGNNIPIKQFASLLNRSSFVNWQSHLHNNIIQLRMPKFQYSYSISNMFPELSAMGMGIAFSETKADLTKIYPQGAYVSDVIHKTYINVDETGTVAAAVTAIETGITSAPSPIMMVIDHPFVYVIQEKTSGVILFIGMVNDPTKQ